MGKVLDFYFKYKNNVPEYNNWLKEQDTSPAKNSDKSISSLQKKAETIAQPLLIADKYEHEKAEDAEAFFQTYNIELLSLTTILSSLPLAVTKVVPFLNKFSDKSSIIKKVQKGLQVYKDASVNIAGKFVSVPKIATLFSVLGSVIFYAKGMKKSMEKQLGIIRKASFDSTQNIINDSKLFAILTEEQEKQVKEAEDFGHKNGTDIVDTIKDRINLKSTFQVVGDYRRNYQAYNEKKSNYFKEKNNFSNSENKALMESLLKNVEHDVLTPLKRIETISNVSYSSLYTGGFLEYLITDKLVDLLGIKNKPLQMAVKIGSPLLTYLLLNKNIANIENKAILATKYKYLKKFINNPMAYKTENETDKQNLPDFLKTVYHDMKEYDKFTQTELPKIEARMEAKKQIKLTQEQQIEAEKLKDDTLFAINKQREHLFNQSVGIKAFSETILGPVDILSTAIGGRIGYLLSKRCQNKKLAGLLTGLGAIIAFIPAAILEAKLTKQQKLSEKTAVMLTLKDFKNLNKQNSKDISMLTETPEIFKSFINTVSQ